MSVTEMIRTPMEQKETAIDLPLRDHIKNVMNTYYRSVTEQGIAPENVYQLFMEEIEIPLLEAAMEYNRQNQSSSAAVLGLNRGTFRKKLAFYGMLNK